MGASLHPASPGGASFELERLEFERGRLVISGWWFGVRGMRFVRPALVVKGRQVLATLEHKPWATSSDGAWTAAFPWKDGARLDVGEVTLVVAPSVEVPLDSELSAAEATPPSSPPATLADVCQPLHDEADVCQPLHDELHALERQLAELREAFADAAVHEARGREVERAAAAGAGREVGGGEVTTAAERGVRVRGVEQAAGAEGGARGRGVEQAAGAEGGVAHRVGAAGHDLVRAHAIAIRDRDRADAQREEAVADRQAAVRARTRMEVQRDEAFAQRDDARRQRDEILLLQRALQGQHASEWARPERTQPLTAEDAAPQAGDELTRPLPAPGDPQLIRVAARPEIPMSVRARPAVRAAAAHLHRAQGARDQDFTGFYLWVLRIAATVAALSFLWLLVMILKALFVF